MTLPRDLDAPFPDEIRTAKKYKLRATMQVRGQPVNWNARAIIWSGTDRREPVRRLLRKLGWRLPHGKIAYFLRRVADDRESERYTTWQRRARRWLNTAEDVEARQVTHMVQKYWRAREKQKQ